MYMYMHVCVCVCVTYHCKIKGRMDVKDKFSFSLVNEDSLKNEIKRLHINKPTARNNIPAKVM